MISIVILGKVFKNGIDLRDYFKSNKYLNKYISDIMKRAA